MSRVTENMIINQATIWRAADVHHGAIVLGIREGDERQAKQEADLRLNGLRKLIDDFHKEHAHDEQKAGAVPQISSDDV